MTISDDLFLAILSMDTFNRGYGAASAACQTATAQQLAAQQF